MEPNEIANQISSAIENTAESQQAQIDLEKEHIDLERQRIKSEERIAERMAERDENIATIEHDTNYYRSMLDELFTKFDSILNSNNPANQIPQTIEIDAGHNEVPEAANEDTSEFESPEESDEAIEEIGENEEGEKPPENPIEEKNESRRSRRKRGRR